MSVTTSNLLVAVADEVPFVKIIGRANVAVSVQFKTLIGHLRERGYRNFVLDLGGCSTMDSTFMGVLVGVALSSAQSAPAAGPLCLQLLNPTQRVAELLENLGVGHLFTMVQGSNPAETALQPAPTAGVGTSHEEISQTCLEAHRLLMAVNPENIPKFKDVTQFLEEDLKKSKP